MQNTAGDGFPAEPNDGSGSAFTAYFGYRR
jgi:hypothetical protein